jgi:hypothetical protein
MHKHDITTVKVTLRPVSMYHGTRAYMPVDGEDKATHIVNLNIRWSGVQSFTHRSL